MIGQIFPLFHEGCLLRTQMLEAFTDYSFRFGELLYTGYADGILSGCQMTTTGDAVIVNPGLVLFYGKVFYIKEPVSVNYKPTDEPRVLNIRYLGEERADSMIRHEMELSLDAGTEQKEGQIELCRFTLQQGAYLRCRYQDFEDMGTEYDTLSMVHAPYAAPERSTLHPQITKAFAREMLSCMPEDQTDTGFCLEILSRPGPVCAEALMAYISLRSGRGMTDPDNAGIYRGLLDILRGVKGNGSRKKEAVRKHRSIVVE